MEMLSKRILLAAVVVVVVILLGLQLVPVQGRDNPEPLGSAITWDSPQTEALMRRACYDCHSNDTRWPFYAYIAPVSWLVTDDVREGRDAMNLSTGTGEIEGEEMIEQIREGEMPLPAYLITHPEANLSPAEREQLIQGIANTLGGEEGESGEDEGGEADEDDD